MIELRIQGMTCQHCVAAVREALADVPGVTQVVFVDLETRRARVDGTAMRSTLVEAVIAAGYQVESEDTER
ncbi:heavy metal-associated domain-containing protein [Thioalkalicoccus limnaeus]|uniref:Heavy metal-associated domain-containing protein n=1 Tax=Thioalkalicoccus limnaeus TaxID=120681 RepID=A0ABV4BA50_9GAMM